MTAFYHKQGKSLLDRLAELYGKYGYYRETLKTFVFEGISGKAQMDAIIARLAKEGITLRDGETPVAKDYSAGIEGLPPSKVLSFTDSKARLTVRPSGTEPKLKVYVSAKADSAEAADAEAQAVLARMRKFIEA